MSEEGAEVEEMEPFTMITTEEAGTTGFLGTIRSGNTWIQVQGRECMFVSGAGITPSVMCYRVYCTETVTYPLISGSEHTHTHTHTEEACKCEAMVRVLQCPPSLSAEGQR